MRECVGPPPCEPGDVLLGRDRCMGRLLLGWSQRRRAARAVLCLYCMYWYSVGSAAPGAATRFACGPGPSATLIVYRGGRHAALRCPDARVSKRARCLHETPAGFVRGATPAGSHKRYGGPVHRVARAPTAGGTAGTTPSRQFLERLTAALPAADAGTERVTSSAPRQHRSERTGA